MKAAATQLQIHRPANVTRRWQSGPPYQYGNTSMHQNSSRWKNTMVAAAQNALAVRWHIVTEDLLMARAEYLALLEAEITDVSAVRKAAQRLHDLQLQCGVLTRELQE